MGFDYRKECWSFSFISFRMDGLHPEMCQAQKVCHSPLSNAAGDLT